MTNSVLIKTNLKRTIAESILDEIASKNSRFFYFFGRPQSWDLDYAPFTSNDSYKNEADTRGDIVYAKQIAPTDVCLVANRIDWAVNTVFDRFDDEYSTELVGINLTFGGTGYTSAPTVVISGTGTGAAATATISNITGKVTGITVTSRGTGYINSISNPLTISFTGGGGTGAAATGVLVNGQGNTTKLEDTKYYVLTDDFNVYICLDNGNGSLSTIKPFGNSSSPLATGDGYIWKYLYTVPLALRSRFLNSSYIPVATSLKSQFYSAGALGNLRIDSGGSGYTGITKIVVAGDGFLENNPVYVSGYSITTPGAGYTTATPAFTAPFSGATTWVAARLFSQGQVVVNGKNYYFVSVAGTSSATAPTHTIGTVSLGASFKYIGTIAEATATVAAGAVTALTLKQGVREINITNGGTGYANGPNTVVFSSGAATAVSYAQNGVIYRVDITDPAINTYTTLPTITSFGGGGTGAAGTVLGQSGAGYSAAPVVSFTGTGTITTPAVATATTTKSEALVYPVITGGVIVGTIIVNGGVSYTAATLTVTGVGTAAKVSADIFPGDVTSLQSSTELSAIDGAIHNIQVVSGGYGYTSPPTVSIRGDGTGATATCSVVSGVITGFTVTNIGSGYRKAQIVLTGGGGVGAVARAILPPFGGHGRNVVRALNTRALMFQTNVSKDKVSGFNLAADYRQFGILRNVLGYGTTNFFTDSNGTACWTITSSTTIPGAFVPDSLMEVVPITGSITTTVASILSSNSFTVASAAGLVVGMSLAGTGVVSGTTITDIVSSTITVSAPISGLTVSTSLRFNFKSLYRLVFVSGTTAIIQSMGNSVPSVSDTFNFSGNIFAASAITTPSIDKYSGELLYQDNQVPFTPTDGTSEKITVSTVLKF